jgi:Ulp1 family protease
LKIFTVFYIANSLLRQYGWEGSKYLKSLLRWLTLDAVDKNKCTINPKEWKLVSREMHVPQQTNGCDCGVFLTICADYLSDDLPLAFDQNMILFFREKIGTDIMRGSLLYPDVTMRMDKTSDNNTRPFFLYS